MIVFSGNVSATWQHWDRGMPLKRERERGQCSEFPSVCDTAGEWQEGHLAHKNRCYLSQMVPLQNKWKMKSEGELAKFWVPGWHCDLRGVWPWHACWDDRRGSRSTVPAPPRSRPCRREHLPSSSAAEAQRIGRWRWTEAGELRPSCTSHVFTDINTSATFSQLTLTTSNHYQCTQLLHTVCQLLDCHLVRIPWDNGLVISTKEDMFSSLFVCLFVSKFARKLPNGFSWNFHGRLAIGQWTNH